MSWDDCCDDEPVNPEDDDREADFYDIMRDDSGCELWSDLTTLCKNYTEKYGGTLIYFKDDPKRFWESVEHTAQYELSELKKAEELKCKQTKLNP